MLKFNYVLSTVNYFKATISMKLPYVPGVKPPHSSLINLQQQKINKIYYMSSLQLFFGQNSEKSTIYI